MAHSNLLFETHNPKLDVYIKDEEDQMPEALYSKIFEVKTIDRLDMLEKTYSGLGPMDEVGEQGNAVEDQSLDGYGYTYSKRYFRKKTVFSKPMLNNDQTGKVEEMARDLPRSQRYSREMYIWGMIRNAFNVSYLFGDGKAVVSVLHPLKSGGTFCNTFTSGVQKPLSYDNALELQDVMNAFTSNSGNIMTVADQTKNKVIFGPPPLREKLFQIAGTEGPDRKPGDFINDNNYFRKGDKFDVMVVPWIKYEVALQAGDTAVAKTSSSNIWDAMWGIIDMSLIKKYFRVYQEPGYPNYDSDVNKENESIIKYAYDHYCFGNTAPLCIAMSKADNSTLAT